VLRFVFVPLKIQPLVISKLRHFLILNEKIVLAASHVFVPRLLAINLTSQKNIRK